MTEHKRRSFTKKVYSQDIISYDSDEELMTEHERRSFTNIESDTLIRLYEGLLKEGHAAKASVVNCLNSSEG